MSSSDYFSTALYSNSHNLGFQKRIQNQQNYVPDYPQKKNNQEIDFENYFVTTTKKPLKYNFKKGNDAKNYKTMTTEISESIQNTNENILNHNQHFLMDGTGGGGGEGGSASPNFSNSQWF